MVKNPAAVTATAYDHLVISGVEQADTPRSIILHTLATRCKVCQGFVHLPPSGIMTAKVV